MKKVMAAFFVGLLFALGLGLAQMTNPEYVLGFLDIAGNWNPTLLFVMIGALAIHAPFYRLLRKRPKPILDTQWHVPTSRHITTPLVLGAFLFGMGWALSGFCPGPALVSLGTLSPGILLFLVGLLAGMLLFRALDRILKIQR